MFVPILSLALFSGGCAWGSGKEWVQSPLPEEGSSSGGSSGSMGGPSSGGRTQSRTLSNQKPADDDPRMQRGGAFAAGRKLPKLRRKFFEEAADVAE